MRKSFRRALVVVTLAGVGAMTAAPGAFASTTVEAYGIKATGLVTLAAQPDATLATPSPASVVSASILGLVNTGVLTASVTQTGTSETATATVASITPAVGSLVGLTTGLITTTCTATAGSNTVGTVNIVNLTLGTTTLNGNIAPNTSLNIAGIATVTINEQTPASPGTGDLVVNAVHITLLGTGQDVIIGHAECGPAPTVTGAPIASGAGLYLGLGLLAFGGLGCGMVYLRRRTAGQPA
ncbi:MAG: choice-of-anchor P family protein [Actinomycetota bacterium]